MSGAVDTKAVEMRFDNANFEKNASQSISTLAKLKEALKLDGASAGLKEVEEASKKLDFNSLKDNVNDAGKKFSILEEVAKGAFRKIGESAAELGLKIVKSLGNDLFLKNFKGGWDKYAEKTTAVQTIMANLRDEQVRFADEATKMDYVTGYLEKLIWFSDETSYSFTEMTNNLGKFIAVGQDLDDSVTAIQGIATWAAMAGQRNAGAARAMYNISQALGVGAMTTIDWKSIENANMATAEFKETAIAAAVAMGKLKEGEVTIESFRESLQKKWFDKDVMMNVFQQYGAAAERIQQYAVDNNVNVQEAIRALKETDKDFAESLGFRAFAAAQEAKTFGEVMEATADAVSSKWLKIFENIFGNYQQAKELWTDFSEQLWEVLAQPLDVLNDIMSKWNRGFFANGPKNIIQRWFEGGKLDDLNNGLEYVTEKVAKLATTSDGATYKISKLADGTSVLVKTVKDASGKVETFYKKIFSPGKDIVSGRSALLQSFQNIFDTLFHDVYDKNDKLEHMSFFGALKRGLQEVVFGTSNVEKIVPKAAKRLWEFTNGFKNLTERLKPSLTTSRKFRSIFTGLFTTFKIGIKFIKAAIKPFKDLISGIFTKKEGERGLLDLAFSMSKWVQNLDKFLERNKIYEKVSNTISSGLDTIRSGVDSLVKAWTGLSSEEYIKKLKDDVFKFFENYDFKAAFDKVVNPIRSFIEQIRQFKTGELPEELTPLQKFLVGFKNVYKRLKQFFDKTIHVLGTIGKKVGTIFRSIIAAFKNFAHQIKQVVSGELPEELTPLQKFLLGIGSVFNFFKETYEKLSMKFPEIVKRIKSFKLSDFKQLFVPIKNFLASVKTSISSLIDGAFGRKSADDMSKSAKRFAPVIRAFASIFEGLGNLFESAGPYIEKIGKAIGEFLTNLGANLDKFVGNKSGLEVLESVVKIFTDFASGKFLLSLAKIDNRFAKLIKVFTKEVPLTMQSIRDIFKGTTDGVNGFFKTLLNHLIGKDRKTVGKAVIEDLEAIKGILTAYKREINAGALIDVALAIGALAASMWVLAQIPSDKLISSGKALAQIAGVVVLLYGAMTAIASIKSYLQDKTVQKGQTIFDSLKAILTSTVKSSIFANDATAKFLKFAAGVFLIAVAIKKVSSCMEEISTGIIAVGKAYSDPKFKDGLEALGFLAAGLALTSLVSSLGRGGLLRTIGVFVVFLLFVKSAKGVIDKISEVGKTTDSASFYKGLEYVAVLLGGLTILSLVASIGRAGSKFVGFLGMLGAMLAMAIFVKSIAKALTGLASVAKDGNLDAAASAILSLMQPIMAFILLTSLLSRSKKGRKATTRAMLALLAGALAIRLIANSLIKIAKVNDADKINAAAKLIQSIGLAVGITLGVLSILGGLSVNKKGFQFNGKTGILRAALGFLAICYGIKMIVGAIKEMAAIGDTTSINFYRAIVQSLVKTIGWTIGLLGALAGLNASVKTGVANVKYNGMIGVPVAALSFVGICYGITLMVSAVKEIASIGDAGAAQKAAGIIESLATVVGVITGSLGAEAGLNFFAMFGPGGVLFSGTLGTLAAAASFAVTCDAIAVMAEAVRIVASAGSVEDAEKAKGILKSLSWVVYGVLALLGAEAGLDGWATIGAAGIAYLGTLGVPMAAFSFLVACRAIGEMAKAVSNIASIDPSGMDKAKDVLKSLSWVMYGVLALLGAEAGLDGWATIGLAGVGFLGTLGVPMAAFSFLVACRAVESIANAVKEIASIGVTEIKEAESVIEVLTEVIGKVTGLLGAESSLDAYINAGTIGISFSGSSGVPTAAASFWAVTEGIKSMADAVKTISDVGNVGSIKAGALSVIKELTGVVTDILDLSVKQWFTSDEMSGKALSFATVATSIKNLAESIKVLTAGGFLTSEEGSGEGVGEQLKTIIASAISGVIDAINEGQLEVSTAADSLAYAVELPITSLDAETWGKDLGSALASGILAMVPTVRSAAEALAAAIRAILGFSEPKEGPLSDFHTYAPDMIKLWNKGVYGNLSSVDDSSKAMSDTIYDGFSSALDYVSDLIDNGMSDQLTIRPVMDLSEIQNGVNSINGMLSTPPTYTVMGTSRLAAAAAYGMGAMNSVATDPQASITDVGPTTNNFYISGADPNAIADRISKLLAQQTRRQKATWAKNK